MLLAVHEPDAHALHRRAGELAVLHRLLDALVDRGPEALRITPPTISSTNS